ncbi:acyl-homoserine-lactone synthase [Methylobacterium sp. J-068]|uniref:acyl-homoserine-lactone synthase n=1 Tax=Methylobacterium sp. J-068 TaxID=2836649 RepID=UPI001FB99FC5|nr:acyl-homoserine-lactone synthase [Methylobacterium sp. J-068]MCJ2034589.1 acyl-homoserine-lactone synthase [Methylobacterium sp. J-068]
MIRILTEGDRESFPGLFDQMFRARAAIFNDRLGWDVNVADGLEVDRYDRTGSAVYIVAHTEDGVATGSLRLLPTMGDTMLRHEFAGFFAESVDVQSPTAWECTRFCVHPTQHEKDRPEAMGRVSSELLIALCQLCLQSGIQHIVGLYDVRMTRIYRRIGWSPDPIASSHSERGHLLVGLWEASPEAVQRMEAIAARNASAPATRRAA